MSSTQQQRQGDASVRHNPADEKENETLSSSNRARKTTKTNHSRRKRNNNDFDASDKPLWRNDDEWHASPHSIQRFKVSSSNVWTRNPSLIKCVLRASANMAREQIPQGAFLLEENVGEILKACRTCTKEAVADKNGSCESKLDRFCVSIHGLRAISSILANDASRKESAQTVLYYAFMTCADIHASCKGKSQLRQNSATLCFAAYEALGILFDKEEVQCIDRNSPCVVRLKRAGNKLDFSFTRFPVPDSKRSSNKEPRDEKSTLQMFTIAIKSTIGVCKILAKPVSDASVVKPGVTDEFGKSLEQDVCGLKARGASFGLLIQLVQSVVVKWISLLKLSGDENAEEDAKSYGKRAFRILWDAAADAENAGVSSQSNLEDVLELRQNAILVLVLHDGRKLLRSAAGITLGISQLEYACSSSQKAASVYAQKKSIKAPADTTERLRAFYKSVGDVLDQLAQERKTGTIEHIVFCAYRYIHLGTQTCRNGKSTCRAGKDCILRKVGCYVVHDVCFTGQDSERHETESYFATLAVIFIVQEARDLLQESHGGRIAETEFEKRNKRLSNSLEKAVPFFRRIFFESMERPSHDTIVGCYKLLSMLSLSRLAYNAIRSANERKSPCERARMNGPMEVLGLVLSDCLAPLADYMSKHASQSATAQEMTSYIGLACDSFVRSGTIMNRLQQWAADGDCISADESRYSQKVDRVIHVLYHSMSDDDSARWRSLKSQSVKSVAKTFENIGKLRVERKEYKKALLPYLYAADISFRLSIADQDATDGKRKLPFRFLHISSLFRSLGMSYGACLACVIGIRHQVLEQMGSSAFHYADLLEEFGCFTHGILGFREDTGSSSNGSLVARLISLFCDDSSSVSIDVDMMTMPLSCLHRSLIAAVENPVPDTTSVNRVSLADLFQQVLFGGAALDSVIENIDIFAARKRLNILIEAMISVGIEIQSRRAKARSCASLSDTDNISESPFQSNQDPADPASSLSLKEDDLLEDFNSILQMALSLAKSFTAASNNVGGILVDIILCAIASTSLISSLLPHGLCQLILSGNTTSWHTELLQRSEELAIRATENLTGDASRDVSQKDAHILLVVRFATGVFLRQLRRILCLDEDDEVQAVSLIDYSFQIFRFWAKHQIEVPGRHCSFAKAIECVLLPSLSIVGSMYAFDGESLLASQAAFISGSFATADEEKLFHEATSISSMISAGLEDLAQQQISGCDDLKPVVVDPGGLNFGTIESIKVELWILSLRLESTDLVDEKIRSLFDDRIRAATRPLESLSDLYSNWVASSCAIGLSDHSYDVGDIEASIRHAKTCYSLCRQCITSSQQFISPRKFQKRQWTDIILCGLPLRLAHRQVESLHRIARCWSLLGQHRTSLQYAYSSCHLANLRISDSSLSFAEVWSQEPFTLASTQHHVCYRVILELKAVASTTQKVSKLLLARSENGHGCKAIEPSTTFDNLPSTPSQRSLEEIWSMLTVGDLLSQRFQSRHQFEPKSYLCAEKYAAELLSIPVGTLFPSISLENNIKTGSTFTSLDHNIRLRKTQLALTRTTTGASITSEHEAVEDLTSIARSLNAPTECRAWAFYCMGMMELENARRSGDLAYLWRHMSVFLNGCTFDWAQDSKHSSSLNLSREHFRNALSILGPSSHILARNALRSLALVTGPDEKSGKLGTSASVLIHSSIGSTARQAVARAVISANNDNETHAKSSDSNRYVADIFTGLDAPFHNYIERSQRIGALFCDANRRLPVDWKFVAVAICPTGELLITSASADKSEETMDVQTVCVFPQNESQFHQDALRPLDELVRRNESQLDGTDSAKVSTEFSHESSKRSWWKERQDIDEALQSLLFDVEAKFFDFECVRSLFASDSNYDHDFRNGGIEELCGNLTARFEQALNFDRDPAETERNDRSNLEKLTVPILKEKLEELHVEKKLFRRMRKDELIDLLMEKMGEQILSADEAEKQCFSGERFESEGCIFLILDENLHRFPFEGLDILTGKEVSRIPSLPFALATLVRANANDRYASDDQASFVDPNLVSYVVDPESNLVAAKERLVPVIEELCTQNDFKWNGVVGSVPEPTFVNDSLKRKNGLFLYFGHGGAQSIFSRKQVDILMTGDEKETRQCRSSVILMGCSSGKLVSVNRKDSELPDNCPLHYEPEGIVLSYLCAGAPCVIGNLWDVTDYDIDRFSIALLKQFMTGDDSLARCVADSRQACKMRRVVGLAPVCYGIPPRLLLKN